MYEENVVWHLSTHFDNQTLKRYAEQARLQGFSASVASLKQTAMTVGATLAEWANRHKVDQVEGSFETARFVLFVG